MRDKVFIFFFALTLVTIKGQSAINGYILNRQTSKPLPYATIGELKQRYGTYSDASGLYNLLFQDENGNDSLKISYLGYVTIFTTVNGLRQNPKIFLEPNPITLMEIVVEPGKKNKTILEIGYFVKKPKRIAYWLPPNSLTLATFIPFPKNGVEVNLKSVNFHYKLMEENSPLRIRVLNVNEKGEPGEDILVDNVIFNDYKKRGKKFAKIDISKYNVSMPSNGVYVALEVIDTTYFLEERLRFGPAIGLRGGDEKSLSRWINSYNYDRWYEDINLPFTFTIGLTVANYTD